MNSDPLVQFLDDHLATILKRPRMWGSLEAVEAIIITLLEVRYFHLVPDREDHGLLDLYRHELAREMGAGNLPLHVRVPEEMAFVQHMQSIVTRIQGQM